MGDSKRMSGAMALLAMKTSDNFAGTVAGEILDEPTEKTGPPEGAYEPRADMIAKARGMRPLTRP